MRRFSILLLPILAACSPQGGADQTPTDALAAPVEVADPAPADPVPAEPMVEFDSQNLKGALPEHLELPFGYHRLFDNYNRGSADMQERRVMVEVRGVEVEQARAALEERLVDLGFAVRESGAQARGATQVVLSRSDGSVVTVRSNARVSRAKSPDATGTIHLAWKQP